jgi:enoyl-CoA hydratase/carnithine racemase
MLMTGAPIIAKVALEYGLADGLWKAHDEIDPQIECWVSQLHNASAPPVSVDFSERWEELAEERHELRTAGLANDQHWQIPARQAIERAVELGIKESPAAAERLEREGFFELLNRPEVQSTLTLFSAPRKN